MVAPTVSREFGIQYGSFLVGLGSSVQLVGGVGLESLDSDELSLSFEALVYEDTEEDFEAKVRELEREFATFGQDVTLTIGSDVRTFSHSDQTAFNIEASAVYAHDQLENTHFSRVYSCRINAGLPARIAGSDVDGRRGLTASDIIVERDAANNRRVTISGSYTGIPTDGGKGVGKSSEEAGPGFYPGQTQATAREQYEREIEAYATSILASVDGSVPWELVPEDTREQRDGFVINFQRVYVDVQERQSKSFVNHPAIKDHSISVRPVRIGRGGSSRENARAPIEVEVVFRCQVDRRELGVSYTSLPSLFQTEIRPVMEDRAKGSLEQGFRAAVVTSSQLDINHRLNSIEAQLVFFVAPLETLLSINEEAIREHTKGIRRIPIHAKNRFMGYLFPGPATLIEDRLVTVTVLGTGEEALAAIEALYPENRFREEEIISPLGVKELGPGEIFDGKDSVPGFYATGGGFIETSRKVVKKQTVQGEDFAPSVTIGTASMLISSFYHVFPRVRPTTSTPRGAGRTYGATVERD